MRCSRRRAPPCPRDRAARGRRAAGCRGLAGLAGCGRRGGCGAASDQARRWHGTRRAVDDRGEQVVVEVAPDAGHVGARRCRAARARPPRRCPRAGAASATRPPGAHDHLALRADPCDLAVARSSTPTQRPPSKSSRCAWAPVRTVRLGARPPARGSERGAVPDAVLDRELAERDALEALAVVVVVERHAGLLRRACDAAMTGCGS